MLVWLMLTTHQNSEPSSEQTGVSRQCRETQCPNPPLGTIKSETRKKTVRTRFRTSLLTTAASAAAMLLAIPASLRAQVYSITDLDTLGSSNSVANAINSQGQVAGQVVTPSGYRAFLYSNGVMTALGALG